MPTNDGKAKPTVCLFKPQQSHELSLKDITESFNQASQRAEAADAEKFAKSLSKFGVMAWNNPNPTKAASASAQAPTSKALLKLVKPNAA